MNPATLNKIARSSYLLVALSFPVLALTAHPAFAQSTGLTAIPPRLGGEGAESLILKPGDNTARTIKVRNESTETREINIEIHDIVVNDDKGTPIILDDAQEKNNRWSAASWIQVSPMQFKLKPGETKAIQVMFLIPNNATPGGHYAGVVHTFKSIGQQTANGSASGVTAKVGTLVYITIPGPVKEDARVTSFSAPSFSEYGPIDFKASVINFSDIHINPNGAIKITNMLGGKTAELALDPTNIFPGTSRDYKATLPNKWLFGRYQAQFIAAYGTTGQALMATLFFWVIPWRMLILLGVITVLISLIVYLNKKKNGQSLPPQDEPEISQLKKKFKDQ